MKALNVILCLAAISGCAGASGTEPKSENKVGQNWNISVLIDLSNRIDPVRHPMNPPQYERDLGVVAALIDIFKEHVAGKPTGTFGTKDKFRVFFQPIPNDDAIQALSQKLAVDFEPLDIGRRKTVFASLRTDILASLDSVYRIATKIGDYEGADLWRFMKDNAAVQCVESDSAFRNVLVIVTDGYMYWKYGQEQKGNRYNYIERSVRHLVMFRDAQTLAKSFNENDYGFIAAHADLARLEIMAVEFDNPRAYPQDFDILRRYWEKWLHEMKVPRMAIVRTDLNIHTRKIIESFLRQKP